MKQIHAIIVGNYRRNSVKEIKNEAMGHAGYWVLRPDGDRNGECDRHQL